MTLLMCQQSPSGAAIFTDTLVTDTRGGKNIPVLYMTKVWPYLHANMVMIVTGLSDLGEAFDDRIRRRIGIRDIEDLNEVATSDLQELHAGLLKWYAENLPGEAAGTATVYLFGFPAGSSELVRYTYRSPKDYESEQMVITEPSFFAKPRPRDKTFEIPMSRDEAVSLAVQIREENGDGTREGTVAIGGDLHLTLLEPNRITIEVLHRFEDYEEIWKGMNELPEGKTGRVVNA